MFARPRNAASAFKPNIARVDRQFGTVQALDDFAEPMKRRSRRHVGGSVRLPKPLAAAARRLVGFHPSERLFLLPRIRIASAPNQVPSRRASRSALADAQYVGAVQNIHLADLNRRFDLCARRGPCCIAPPMAEIPAVQEEFDYQRSVRVRSCIRPVVAWRITSVAMQPLWPLALM